MRIEELLSKSKLEDLRASDRDVQLSDLTAENRYRVALALKKVIKFEGVKDAIIRRDSAFLSKRSDYWWNFFISSYDATDKHLAVSDALETLSTFFQIGGVLNINTNKL